MLWKMDLLLSFLLLSLIHAGHPQDYRSNFQFGRGPENPGGPFIIDGPEGRMPSPHYNGPDSANDKALSDSYGPQMRHYGGGNNNFGPPVGPPQNQFAWPPPPGYRPNGQNGPNLNRPPFPDPFQKVPNYNNKPPYFNGPYQQPPPPPQQPFPGSYGNPPRRPGDYGPPPNRPPWVGAGGYQQGPPNGPPSGFGQPVWPNKKPEPSMPNKPTDFMADVINKLGTKVLLDHISARGNFVFSPYGATSVLSVLSEGASGRTAYQLNDVLDLPKNFQVVRVGMRDLHRDLKAYFKHNGFLQGVDLSHNNTSLREDFIPILRSYGYHVDDENKQQEAATEAPEKVETTTMPMPEEQNEAAISETQNEGDSEPASDNLTEEAATEEQPAEEEATEEAATEEAPEGDEKKRKKRSSKRLTLWKDIALPSKPNKQELNNGLSQPSSSEPSANNDPLAPRKRFRLYSGEFTEPVVVTERTEMLLFSSLPQLSAVAALVPLDEPRYALLVLVPYDGRPMAMKKLVKELTKVPLRTVLGSLRPNHVHFTIPSFSAKGTVVLTSALQQIGIHDIFDPRNAKLDKMSVDPGLFVRHLEQVIDMNFGKVKSVNTRVITARSTTEVFDAMRPFVYFVIDRPSQVALLAGKVEDPTTQRIF
ncbi:proline-rich protein 12 isoform X2 [Cloeon dipterum]|uniref:proline-rich protein 12 isoform X2 n=1 Tax=Cloeon dipterum TaxID=197152 RepID=UPI003220324D